MKKLSIIFLFLSIVGVILYWRLNFLLSEFKVHGNSMYPTFNSGDIVHVDRNSIPKIGDIIVFDCYDVCGDTVLIKRILDIKSDGSIWVEGDNRSASYDSRNFGWIPNKNYSIEGVILLPEANYQPKEPVSAF